MTSPIKDFLGSIFIDPYVNLINKINKTNQQIQAAAAFLMTKTKEELEASEPTSDQIEMAKTRFEAIHIESNARNGLIEASQKTIRMNNLFIKWLHLSEAFSHTEYLKPEIDACRGKIDKYKLIINLSTSEKEKNEYRRLLAEELKRCANSLSDFYYWQNRKWGLFDLDPSTRDSHTWLYLHGEQKEHHPCNLLNRAAKMYDEVVALKNTLGEHDQYLQGTYNQLGEDWLMYCEPRLF